MAAQFECIQCGDVTPQRYLCKECRKDERPEGAKFWTHMDPGGDDDYWVDDQLCLERADGKARQMIEFGYVQRSAVFVGNTLHAEYQAVHTVDTIYKQGA